MKLAPVKLLAPVKAPVAKAPSPAPAPKPKLAPAGATFITAAADEAEEIESDSDYSEEFEVGGSMSDEFELSGASEDMPATFMTEAAFKPAPVRSLAKGVVSPHAAASFPQDHVHCQFHRPVEPRCGSDTAAAAQAPVNMPPAFSAGSSSGGEPEPEQKSVGGGGAITSHADPDALRKAQVSGKPTDVFKPPPLPFDAATLCLAVLPPCSGTFRCRWLTVGGRFGRSAGRLLRRRRR